MMITTVERGTGKHHSFIAGIVYECAARINNTGGNERVMFPIGIENRSSAPSIATTDFKKNCETIDEKSSQTNEMTVKISEKRSELALERAWGVYKEKEDT